MLVLGLGPEVIPDSTPITFFGFYNPHGTGRASTGAGRPLRVAFHASTGDR